MKKIPTTIAFCVMSATGAATLAQTAGPGGDPATQQGVAPRAQANQQAVPGPGVRGGRGDPAQRIQHRVDRMAQFLGLNDEQKTRIKAIMEEQHAKRAAMRQETHERISALLDDQQRAKLEDVRSQRGKGRPGGWGKRGGGQGMGSGPVPAPGN